MSEPATTILTSFNGGEVSPRLMGRVDQALWAISVAELVGWIPLMQGPVVAAPGTYYVSDAAGPCRLIDFEYNVTQGYAIEASDLKLRFYTNDVRIEDGDGVPYEIASPWTYAQTLTLDWQQSADVLYIVGGDQQQRKLTRTGAETFSLSTLNLRNGPIGDGNNDETITVGASDTTGSVTLTASSAIFAATDVGSLFELEAADYNDVPSWEPGITVTAGEKRTWAGKVYQCAGGSTRTGTVAPEHDEGTEWDGSGSGTDVNGKTYGVQWTYLYGRFGLLTITAFTSATEVTATVEKRLADSLTTTASWRWAFGAFSDTRGWPGAVCIWSESLVLMMDNKAYVSVIGDYENFERRDSSGDYQHDLSGSFTLPNPAKINWGKADRLLLMGTEKGEYTVERILTQTGQAGPPVFDVRLQSTNGVKKARPIMADGRILFVQRAGRKVLEMGYAIQTDRYEAPDMTRLADHIGKYGFGEMAWAQEPERLAWHTLDNGMMAAMTYGPSQQVMGWCRRQLGDVAPGGEGALAARSICRVTDPQGKRDQLWIAAECGGQHWILRQTKIWETGDDQRQAFMVDAGLSYDGDPLATFANLDHLEGRTVQILADGKPHPERVVTDGAVTLDYPASIVHVGLGYPSRLKTMPIEAGQTQGTAQGKMKRIVAVTLRLLEALGIRVDVQVQGDYAIETRVPGDPMDQAVPLFTGDIRVDTVGEFERLGQIVVERYQPTPATLLAIIPQVVVGKI